jgi:hypothetical protein
MSLTPIKSIKMSLRLGIDFGGVCSRDSEKYETDSKDDQDINVPGCTKALEELKRQGHYLVLVSFCGKNRADTTRRSKAMGYFHEVYFVKKRPSKSQVCHALGLDVLIDDRSDILAVLQKDKRKTKTVKFSSHPSDTPGFHPDHKANSWEEFMTDVLPRLQAQHLPQHLPVPEELLHV